MENSIDVSRAEKWQRLFAEWQSSGQSVLKWCKEKGISQSTFRYWQSKFSLQDKTRSRPFVELSEEETAATIQIEYQGAKILLSKGFDEGLLTRCLNVLRGL